MINIQQLMPSTTCSQAAGMVAVPCSTGTAQTGVVTDWATVSVSLNPSAPNVGDQIVLSSVITAVSSKGSFPQEARVGCFVDTTFVGGEIVVYPGPVGFPMTVTIPTVWTATLGSHKLTCGVGTIPAGLDPNLSNNLISSTFTVGSPILEHTGITFNPGFQASTSTSNQVSIMPITMHSCTGVCPTPYIFDYSATLNAPPAQAGVEYPGTVDAGKCSNTTSCVITIDKWAPGSGGVGPPGTGCAEYCQQATVAITVNFPSNEQGEPVTLTLSGLPAGATFSWGNELPASTLAPYTAMPPYTVNLTIIPGPGYGPCEGGTPNYGSPLCNIPPGLWPPAPPPDVITITGSSHNSFTHPLATISLTVNDALNDCTMFGTNPDTNPNFLVDCTSTYHYP